MSVELEKSDDEVRVRQVYGEVPVPLDRIWWKMTERPRRRVVPHFGEIAATVALAAALIVTGVIVLPRFAQGSGARATPKATLPTQGQTHSGPHRLAGPFPGSRAFTAMAYDSYRQQVVLFGGSAGGGTLDDTWILHGRTWSTRHPPSHPGALAVELMAYDARTHTCLLVGSATIQGPAQTWSWDGTTWTRLSDLPLEGVEGPQTLAFDPATGHALLLSAMPSDAGIGSHRTRAWTWDGRSWTLGAAPPSFADTAGEARLATVGVGSSSRNGRGVLALFEDAIGTHETWFWDGVTWSKRAAGGTPLYDPELSSTLAEDTTTGDVVLIGLARSDGRSAQTWLWDGTSWRQGVAAPLAASAYHGTLVLSDAASGHAIVIGESTSGNLVNLFDVLWTFDGNSWVSDRGA